MNTNPAETVKIPPPPKLAIGTVLRATPLEPFAPHINLSSEVLEELRLLKVLFAQGTANEFGSPKSDRSGARMRLRDVLDKIHPDLGWIVHTV